MLLAPVAWLNQTYHSCYGSRDRRSLLVSLPTSKERSTYALEDLEIGKDKGKGVPIADKKDPLGFYFYALYLILLLPFSYSW